MSTAEKVAYVKGLFEGLQLKSDSSEAKLFKAIIDVLEDVSYDMEDLEESTMELGEEIDELSDDVALIEEIIYEGFEDFLDDDDLDEIRAHHGHGHKGCCGHGKHGGHNCDDEPMFFELKCPACDNEITIDEDVLELGSIDCPNCGETLEFYFGELDELDELDGADEKKE